VIKKHEPLEDAWRTRSFSIAKPLLEDTLRPEGFVIDESLPPVRLKGKGPMLEASPAALGFDYKDLNRPQDLSLFSIRANFENEQQVEKLVQKHSDEVIGVFADPTISAISAPSYCDPSGGVQNPVGDWKTVAKKLGTSSLKLTGKGVKVAIVDTGIDSSGIGIAVDGGWAPPGVHYQPGTAQSSDPRQAHGTMCAYDAHISAPDAKMLDYALLRSTGGPTFNAFLSDAIAAFADLIDLLEREPGSLVVNNSWGLFDRSEDEPIGSPGNYSANLNHPFNQIVGSLVAAGADVLFAAGNCGADCPDGRCGTNDIGPGKSIHGANSHPDAITVAAITTDGRRLGYSSQGPGGLYQRKPDIAAYSHFKGSGVYPADGGTSAASPVAAGVVAALREKFSNSVVSPARLKGTIQRTAIDVNNNGWDYDLGYGIINPTNVLNAFKQPLRVRRPTRRTTRRLKR
jgi:subtilisin family serine protease